MGSSRMHTFCSATMTYSMWDFGQEIWQGNIGLMILMILHINLVLLCHFICTSCRRKVLLELFGENSGDISCPEQCCDVCDQKIGC